MACIANMSQTVQNSTKLYTASPLRGHALQELDLIWLLAFVIGHVMSNALLVSSPESWNLPKMRKRVNPYKIHMLAIFFNRD